MRPAAMRRRSEGSQLRDPKDRNYVIRRIAIT
jgi:hypothetical protein